MKIMPISPQSNVIPNHTRWIKCIPGEFTNYTEAKSDSLTILGEDGLEECYAVQASLDDATVNE